MKTEFTKANPMFVISSAILITALIVCGFNTVIKSQEARAAVIVTKAVSEVKNIRSIAPLVVMAKRLG